VSEEENVIAVGDDDFEAEVEHSELPVLVDFYADWCGPCKMVKPIIAEVASERAGKLKVCKVDVDKSQETAARFGVMSIPTLILVKAGEVVDQKVGAVSKANLLKWIDSKLV